jgi:hypothetical protein
MLSVNISAYKGNIPRNHVLVSIPFFSIILQFIFLYTGYHQEVSFRSASRYWTRLCQLGKDIAGCQLFSHSISRQSEKIGMWCNINFLSAERAYMLFFLYIGQGKHKVQHQYICPRTVGCPRYSLSTNGATLHPCCPHGKYFSLFFLAMSLSDLF